jgi:hypothetical protein
VRAKTSLFSHRPKDVPVKNAPEELVLDFDATDCPLYCKQEDRFFHGYYEAYCYLPFYVFCGEQMLAAYLRPSKIEDAKHAAAILKLLVTRLRQVWPTVKIIFRADTGFCCQRILNWCDRRQVQYVVGLARNKRLQAMVAVVEAEMVVAFDKAGMKQRRLVKLVYGARTWKTARRCAARLEFGEQGNNPRFVVTNIKPTGRDAAELYDQLYCPRGEAENRIKEAQLGLFATRTSCQYFDANQFRILLSALAYTMVGQLRALALKDTPSAECGDLQDGTACLEQRIAQTRAAGRRDDTNQARLPCRGGDAWRRTVHDRKNQVDGDLQHNKYVISSPICNSMSEEDVTVKYAG